MKLSLGFSPCPNDTFIFYALLHNKIPTKGISFDPYIDDVEALNQRASSRSLQITKISFNAFLDISDQYLLLNSGSALGHKCGPLLISKEDRTLTSSDHPRIAIPGTATTANFLLDYYLPFPVDKQVMRFDEIEDQIIAGNVDAGVIIHENRFTYRQRGLHLLKDLGEHWESRTNHPIPLGGIIIRKDLSPPLCHQIDQLLRRSIEYAWSNQEEVLGYVRQFAQEMDEEVMMSHIRLYVNEYTSDLGQAGRKAVETFFEAAIAQGRSPAARPDDIFLSYL